jgi:hypothetical protein
MTTLRIILAALVIVLGLYYCTIGALAAIAMHTMGTGAFPLIFTASLAVMLLLGVIAVACGIGLLLLRPWSRQVWLTISAFLILFHLFWLVHDYRTGAALVSLVPAVLIVSFCVASWLFLSSPGAQHIYRSRQVI